MSALLTLTTGNDGRPYDDFLREKVAFDRSFGFDVADADLSPIFRPEHPDFKPHQRDIVKWAVKGGRRAIFARYGLGKSVMQLEALRLCTTHPASGSVNGRGLLVAPLGVRFDIIRDARDLLGIEVRFVRRTSEIDLAWSGLYVTNYESVRDGKLDVSLFDAVSLDEAAVLRSYGSDTYQTFLPLFAGIRYRFVATATPSPNRHKELIHYAGFLGIMDTGQALTRFFKRDSSKANELHLYPHKRREFWLWLNTWACFLQRPSDLGHSDAGYDLPGLDVRWHAVEAELQSDQIERDGQGVLVRGGAMSMVDAAREKRHTLEVRVAEAMRIVKGYVDDIRGEAGVQPGVREAEPGDDQRAASRAVRGGPGTTTGADRAHEALAGAEPGEVSGADGGAGPRGGERPLARVVSGESGARGSDEPAEQAAARVWPDAGGVRADADGAGRDLRDLPDGHALTEGGSRSRDGGGAGPAVPPVQHGDRAAEGRPGPDAAGDRVSDQLIIWCDLNDEQDALERELTRLGLTFSSIRGSLSDEEIERRLNDWRDRRTAVLIGKPVMLGQGLNLQQCNKAIWVGVTYKFEQTIQSLHRVLRFGQSRRVQAHFIYAETESEVRSVLEEKWVEHDKLAHTMSDVLREFGLSATAISTALTRAMGVKSEVHAGEAWTIALNDSVIEWRDHVDRDSFGLIVTSIPFGNHYEYSPNYADFGHTDDNAQFWWQMDYLTPSLLRALMPGRLLAVHVKDRQLFGSVTGAGVYTVSPLHAEAIAHYTGHGFDYFGAITVTTDVVRENNQTYRLSYSKMLRDHTPMGVGSPEYVLLFHKPQTNRSKGWADTAVEKDREAYSVGRWQIDADAHWRSSGDRLLSIDELATLEPGVRSKLFTAQSTHAVYDYAAHVALADRLAARNALPGTFASLVPGSARSDVWTDILRIDTLNSEQQRRAVEAHICPFPLEIPRRLITEYSNPGELVGDPFSGLGSTVLEAVKQGRRGFGSELNPVSVADSITYLRRHDDVAATPTLFDLLDIEGNAA